MAKKVKNKITKEDMHKIKMSAVREAQKRAGFFDGRFVSRTENDKSKYSRKRKHKNNY